MNEEDIIVLGKNLPYDVFYVPQKKEVPDAFVVGSQQEVFSVKSEKWFIFFTNENTREEYVKTALQVIEESIITLYN